MERSGLHHPRSILRLYPTLETRNIRMRNTLSVEASSDNIKIVRAKMHDMQSFIAAQRPIQIIGAALHSRDRIPPIFINDSQNLQVIVLEDRATITCSEELRLG